MTVSTGVLSDKLAPDLEPAVGIESIFTCHHGVLEIVMSNPHSTDTSRSASPSSGSEPKPRLVSGSLKDRIAKFNNPSAAPLLPTHPFGTAGPGTGGPSGGGTIKKGLYGNRIPSLDPKSAGHVPVAGRKVSERGGLIGNRIPSSVSGSSVAALAGGAGASGGGSTSGGPSAVPGPKAPGIGYGRPSSPAGSVDSSAHSAPGDSAGYPSPGTSRSSSPPTSPGGGLPPSLLAATLPDIGGPGAMTPSSTRADAGEETSERSAPSTPVVGATIQLPPAEYDLVPGNLKLAAAAQMSRGLSGSSAAALRGLAGSVTSSLASQYDPSSQGNEEKQMMQDVSGISTPTGTPRAAYRELEGSVRGEGSVADEGSVVGDGDHIGQRDMDNVTRKLEGLAVRQDESRDEEHTSEAPGHVDLEDREDERHREEGMEVEVDDHPTPSGDIADPIAEVQLDSPPSRGPAVQESNSARNQEPEIHEVPDEIEDDKKKIVGSVNPSKSSRVDPDEDPNKASDLDALKRGDLSRSKHHESRDPTSNPINALAEVAFEQNMDEQVIKPGDKKEQGGHAGTRFLDVEKPDEIIPPPSESTESEAPQTKELGPEMEMRPATPVEQGGNLDPVDQHENVATAKVIRRAHQQGPNDEVEVEIKHEDDDDQGQSENESGSGDKDHKGMHAPGGIEANLDDPAKNDFVNEAFSGDLEAYAEPDEEAKEGDLGTLAPPSHVEYVGPQDISASERVGVGQSAVAEANAAKVTSDVAEGNSLQHPDQHVKMEDGAEEKLDKRDGKTYMGELKKEEERMKEVDEENGSVSPAKNRGVGVATLHGKAKGKDAPLKPLHFELVDGTPVNPDGDLRELPVKQKEQPKEDEAEAESKPPRSKEGRDDDMMALPTSDGSTVQVPKRMEEEEDNDEDQGDADPQKQKNAPVSESAEKGETVGPDSGIAERQFPAKSQEAGSEAAAAQDETKPISAAQLETRSEEPIPTSAKQLAGKPLQINIEPAPIVQPAEPTSPSLKSEQSKQDMTPTPPEPSKTPIPPNFPEPPHNDPDDPPKSAKSTTTDFSDSLSLSGTGRSSTPLDPAIMRSFPDVPDEEHPRVEIHVSPHVTPAKSPFDRSAGTGGSPSSSRSRVEIGSTESGTKEPQTPGREKDAGGLEVEGMGTDTTGGATGLSKKKSNRRSPKSPLLDDEDPGDFVPGEEGWAVVTKGRDM